MESEDDFVLVHSVSDAPLGGEITDAYLADIDRFIRGLAPVLWHLNSFLHDNPELAFQEHKSHDALTAFMQSREGWCVTRSAYGMETAWAAEYDSGRPGPIVNFNAEMDALPVLGHACGHNLIAVVSVAAALATADTMCRHHLPGKVLLLGTPAEEGDGGGKIRCLKAGAYDGVDVSLISHPGILNNSPLVRTTAYSRLRVAYHGRAAHAARSPWQGVNALDALIVAYTAVSALRQQTQPDDIIGLQITDGGDRPNVIHAHAAGVAVLRAASSGRLAVLQRKVEACFRAGGEATGARVTIDAEIGYMNHVPNRVLAAAYARHWEALPEEDEGGDGDDGTTRPPNPPLPPPGEFTWVVASTDQGNVSHALPSMNVSFAIPPGPEAGQPHSPDFERASGARRAFSRAMRVAKAMAGTAVDVCATPGMLEAVQKQWQRDMDEDQNDER